MAEEPHNISLTPYHYTNNNPILFIDVNGEDWYVNGETGDLQWYNGTYEDDAIPEGYTWLGDDEFFGKEAYLQTSIWDAMNYNESTDDVEFSDVVDYKGEDAINYADNYGFKLVPTEISIRDEATVISAPSLSKNHRLDHRALIDRSWEVKSFTYAEKSATPVNVVDPTAKFDEDNGITQVNVSVDYTYRWRVTNPVQAVLERKLFVAPLYPAYRITNEYPYKLKNGNFTKHYKKRKNFHNESMYFSYFNNYIICYL